MPPMPPLGVDDDLRPVRPQSPTGPQSRRSAVGLIGGAGDTECRRAAALMNHVLDLFLPSPFTQVLEAISGLLRWESYAGVDPDPPCRCHSCR